MLVESHAMSACRDERRSFPSRNLDGFFKTFPGGGVIETRTVTTAQIEQDAMLVRGHLAGALQNFYALLIFIALPRRRSLGQHLSQRILWIWKLSVHECAENKGCGDSSKPSLRKDQTF